MEANKSFEQKMKRLQEIVSTMEKGDEISLEDSRSYYLEAKILIEELEKTIEDAKKDIDNKQISD